jgi:hypothetical protein
MADYDNPADDPASQILQGRLAAMADVPGATTDDKLQEISRYDQSNAASLQEDGDGTYLGDRLMNATNQLHESAAAAEQPPAESPGLLDQLEDFGHQAMQTAQDTYSQAEHYVEEHAHQLMDEVQPDQ